jgi:hypothetical protein
MMLARRRRAMRTRDAQSVNDKAGTLADSTRAAHCDDRDFGTSHFHSSWGQNTPLFAVKEGLKSESSIARVLYGRRRLPRHRPI